MPKITLQKRLDMKTKKPKKKKKKIKPEFHFISNSGEVIKDLKELAMNLDAMSDEDFLHHVTEDRNDFSKWIGDVFKERRLAEELLWITDKKETQIALLKHFVKKR